MKKCKSNGRLPIVHQFCHTNLKADGKLRKEIGLNKSNIFDHICTCRRLLSDYSSDLVIIMRRLVPQAIGLVVEGFPEAIIHGPNYCKLLIAMASGLLMALTEEAMPITESCALP